MLALLLAAASIPILTHPLPPLSDYANHLARTYVINAIDRDPFLARYYLIDWDVVPNLMVDLLVPLFNHVMNIYAAGQLFTVLAFAMIVSGTLALHRALFGCWSPLPLFATLFLYNGVFAVGVLNYVFGIGLALWGLAAWVALRERGFALRIAVSTLTVAILFFCHLFALGLYGLGLLAIELHRLWTMRRELKPVHLVDFVATGLPFLGALLLIVSGPTVDAPGIPSFWEWGGKYEGLELVFNAYYPVVGYGLLAALAAGIAVAIRRRVLHFHPLGWFLLGVGLVVYIAMPRAIFAAHLADQRLPIALAFMLIACFDVQLRSQFARGAVVALLAVLLAVRVAEVQYVWDDLSPRASEFLQSVSKIERGSRVLVVHGSGGADEEITNNDLMHAASLATIERSALVTTAFTVPGKHILHVRKEYRRFVDTEDRWPPSLPYFLEVAERGNPARRYFWEYWPRHYDYVYILFTERGAQCPDRKHLSLVYDGPEFQLYRVIKSGQAGASPPGSG